MRTKIKNTIREDSIQKELFSVMFIALHFLLLALWAGDIALFKENSYQINMFSQKMSDFLADFFVEYGAICSTGTVRDILKKWEKQGVIEIHRNPEKTSTGKPATYMIEGAGKSVSLRWKK